MANLAWYIDHIPMERVSGRSDTEANLKEVGKAIRVRRLDLDISQEALAHLANIDRSHMGKIERGERNVTLLNLLKIARALSCRPSELLGAAGL
ncbi:C.AhdI domain protein [Burkholderia cepacia]|nr:C.AhdI domain protein [Burkholderia cepacia]